MARTLRNQTEQYDNIVVGDVTSTFEQVVQVGDIPIVEGYQDNIQVGTAAGRENYVQKATSTADEADERLTA